MENRVGVCDFSFPCGGIVGIEMAGRSGFEGMQIMDQQNLREGFPLLNPIVREMYMNAAKKHGIVFQGLNLYALCFSNIMGSPMNSSNGELIRNYVQKSVKTCELMNIKTIMMNVNNIHFIAKPSPEIMRNIQDILTFSNRLCEEKGIVLSIETCIPAKMFHELREQVGENLKMCFDIANPVYHGIGEPCELIKQYGLDAIDHFHIKDFKEGYFGYLTQNSEMCYPGEGGAGFEKCMKIIREGGFKGWFISESIYMSSNFIEKGTETPDYIEIAKKDASIIRQALRA